MNDIPKYMDYIFNKQFNIAISKFVNNNYMKWIDKETRDFEKKFMSTGLYNNRELRRDPRFPNMILWTSMTDAELAQESIEMEKIANEIERKFLFGDNMKQRVIVYNVNMDNSIYFNTFEEAAIHLNTKRSNLERIANTDERIQNVYLIKTK